MTLTLIMVEANGEYYVVAPSLVNRSLIIFDTNEGDRNKARFSLLFFRPDASVPSFLH